MISICKSLDDLVEQLKSIGYNLKRNSVYFRLLPRRQDSIEGKRHKKLANVKLRRTQNNQYSKNLDCWFAAITMQIVEELAAVMGTDNVAILGKDDKSLISMGLPAANKQSPILMTLEYPVTLPDHTFVVASKHKLIPSVYASRELNKDGLSYSGPTHASIRSLKHDKVDAISCMEDLNNILGLKEFEPFLKQNEEEKPIWIFTHDGHDGLRFPTTRQTLITFFQNHELDLLIAVCNAAGLSAYHFIERRMAPLSKELAGILLPHNSFGTHLDMIGVTVDPEKEEENFKKAGETLAEIWPETKIDKYPVSARWIDCSDDSKKYKHYTDTKMGTHWLEKLPFDLYCSSVKIDDTEYCCAYCKKICTTKALMKLHLRALQHHSFEIENDEDDE